MTIANNYVPIRQLGNGVTTQFSAAWSMLQANYANVLLEDAVTNVQTPVTQGGGTNQYQIVITSSGFTVTFGTAPTSGQYAVIGRITGQDQLTPYTTSTGFQGPVEEASFDKLTAMVQDNQNTLSRAITVPLGDTATTLQLPTALARANGFQYFDASGNVAIASGVTGVPVSVAMTPVLAAASTSTALTLLGGTTLAASLANVLATANLYTKGQDVVPFLLTDAATVNPDFSQSNNFLWNIGGNRTLGIPTNQRVGSRDGWFKIIQDNTGTRTISTAWMFTYAGGTAFALSTAAGASDSVYYSQKYYNTSVVTVTIAAPGVMTWTAHGLNTTNRLQLTTTGALPTGLSANTTYWITKIDANSFKLSTSLANCVAGTFITTTGSQNGVHTAVAGEIELSISKAVA